MKKPLKLPELAQNLRDLTDQFTEMTGKLSEIDHDLKTLKGFPSLVKQDITPSHYNIAGGPSNIILFPSAIEEPYRRKRFRPSPFLAIPGKSLPPGILDYRSYLQRNGLVLLSWDKRMTERGELYTAYWVTSVGTPRFYASRPLSVKDFSSACPDHKSYAAEDGIEFYGQEAPDYMVHVAPELMMSNPRHGELRQVHIKTLKNQGSKVDFDYKYLLTAEKNKHLPPHRPGNHRHHRAGA